MRAYKKTETYLLALHNTDISFIVSARRIIYQKCVYLLQVAFVFYS